MAPPPFHPLFSLNTPASFPRAAGMLPCATRAPLLHHPCSRPHATQASPRRDPELHPAPSELPLGGSSTSAAACAPAPAHHPSFPWRELELHPAPRVLPPAGRETELRPMPPGLHPQSTPVPDRAPTPHEIRPCTARPHGKRRRGSGTGRSARFCGIEPSRIRREYSLFRMAPSPHAGRCSGWSWRRVLVEGQAPGSSSATRIVDRAG
ncbi:hypothetical protein GQ55_7G185400 [Panicum hallii var. hallii]|uniref:Uncharacterized protein n=1 Tax=Panicum hallii var. hallii TaxID=1504633 RepID=A0A2T7CWE8_9POAL|nr:hypothetical protein GQ55_7G185400 [Panicum hallii var. hallii]